MFLANGSRASRSQWQLSTTLTWTSPRDSNYLGKSQLSYHAGSVRTEHGVPRAFFIRATTLVAWSCINIMLAVRFLCKEDVLTLELSSVNIQPRVASAIEVKLSRTERAKHKLSFAVFIKTLVLYGVFIEN